MSNPPRGVASSMAWAVALLGAMSTPACSTAATVRLTSGEEVHGRIMTSSRESIDVRTEHGLRVVPRAEVADIHHPGDPAIIAGSIIASLSATMFVAAAASTCTTADQPGSGTSAVDAHDCDASRNAVAITGAQLLTTALVVLVVGVDTRYASMARADPAAPHRTLKQRPRHTAPRR